MNCSLIRLLFYGLLCSVVSGQLLADEPTKLLLPAHAVWVMRYDAKLDGELTGKIEDAVRWSLTVRNDRITGGLDGMKVGDAKDHRVAGEIAAGKPPILVLRQDGPNGLTCYYTGKLIGEGRAVGTWFDNRGGSGDFEMIAEKKK
jgi:hypothetical protein